MERFGFRRALRSVGAFSCLVLVTGTSGVLLEAGEAAAAPLVWSVTSSPNVGSYENGLVDVSCTSATFCVAVGAYDYDPSLQDAAVALIESWNGTTWSLGPPAGANFGALAGVSCTSPTFCMAVGFQGGLDASARQPLIVSFNGTVWSLSPGPSPSLSGSEDMLNSVSCTSPTFCVAVGTQESGPLIESWNGTAWSVVSIPTGSDSLAGVSCTSPTFCVAVGEVVQTGKTLVESWDGTSWTVISSPNSVAGDDSLSGVSCTSPTFCVAVGSFPPTLNSDQPAIESWNGTAWSLISNPTVNSDLDSVSCTGPSFCVAFGVSSDGFALFESWNGTAWSIPANPPPGVVRNVSCTSTCMVVGEQGSASGQVVTLAAIGTPAKPVIVPGSASVAEGSSGTTALKVPVTLSFASAQTVTARWRTVFVPGAPDNQAQPTTDYVPANGTITFAPGKTTQTVTITVKGGAVVKPHEYIVVQFGAPTNATMGGYWGLGFGGIT